MHILLDLADGKCWSFPCADLTAQLQTLQFKTHSYCSLFSLTPFHKSLYLLSFITWPRYYLGNIECSGPRIFVPFDKNSLWNLVSLTTNMAHRGSVSKPWLWYQFVMSPGRRPRPGNATKATFTLPLLLWYQFVTSPNHVTLPKQPLLCLYFFDTISMKFPALNNKPGHAIK